MIFALKTTHVDFTTPETERYRFRALKTETCFTSQSQNNAGFTHLKPRARATVLRHRNGIEKDLRT